MKAVATRAPLSPSEQSRRVEAARAGAAHQDEVAVEFSERSKDGKAFPESGIQVQADAGTEEQRGGNEGPVSAAVIEISPPRHRPFSESHPVDEWIVTDRGMRRWRPILDDFVITPLPTGGRVLQIGRYEIRLDRERAQHISRLLFDETE